MAAGQPTSREEVLTGSAQDRSHDAEWRSVWKTAVKLGAPGYWSRSRAVRSLLPSSETRLLCLDAGCGTGEFVEDLLRRGHTVHCFDPSPLAIDALAARLCPRYFHRLLAFTATFETFRSDLKYDFILCTEVLEHLQDDTQAMHVIANHLADNGLALITVPSDPKQWSREDVVMGHHRRYTLDKLSGLGRVTGLRLTRVHYHGFPVVRLYKALIRPLHTYSRAVIASASEPDRGWARPVVRGILSSVALLALVDTLFSDVPCGIGLTAVFAKCLRR